MVPDGSDRAPGDDSVAIRVEQGEVEPITHTIVRAMAAVKDARVAELAPLYDRVDPDALTGLLDVSTARDAPVEVEFRYEGHRVVASGEGTVRIHDE